MTLKTRSISIDFAIHKLIEANRNSFEESPNDVLRRLLGLPKSPVPTPLALRKSGLNSFGNGRTSGRSWCYGGVELPAGTELSLDYPGVKKEVSGVVHNGVWEIEGEQFSSPSRAAITIVSRERGEDISLNGWLYWKIRCPGETEWIALNSLRNSADIPQRRR